MTETVITAAALLGMENLIEELGGDPHSVAREAGIDPVAFSDPNGIITGDAFLDFLELAVRRCNCPDFGIRFAMRWPAVALGPLWLDISAAETAGDAATNFVRHFQVFGNAAAMRAENVDGELLVRFEPIATGRWGAAQWVDACFAYLCNIVRVHAHPGWMPSVVRVRHAPPNTELYRQTFGSRLAVCQSEDSVLIDADSLAIPLKARGLVPSSAANAEFTKANFRTPSTIKHQTEVILRTLLPHTECTLDAVASALGVSRRTLQRRLHETGTTFNAVLDEARAKLAWRYVTQSPMRFHAVAEILGFTLQPAFSHAFRRWYGQSPREARKKARESTDLR